MQEETHYNKTIYKKQNEMYKNIKTEIPTEYFEEEERRRSQKLIVEICKRDINTNWRWRNEDGYYVRQRG